MPDYEKRERSVSKFGHGLIEGLERPPYSRSTGTEAPEAGGGGALVGAVSAEAGDTYAISASMVIINFIPLLLRSTLCPPNSA